MAASNRLEVWVRKIARQAVFAVSLSAQRAGLQPAASSREGTFSGLIVICDRIAVNTELFSSAAGSAHSIGLTACGVYPDSVGAVTREVDRASAWRRRLAW